MAKTRKGHGLMGRHLTHGSQIRTGHKGFFSCTLQDHGLHPFIIPQPIDTALQFLKRQDVQRIQDFGPIDADNGHAFFFYRY